MNKTISVWRGSKWPPTNYHLWVDEKNNVKLWDTTDWKTIADGENYADIVEHLESFPKIDVVNEIPNGSDFKNGDFLLYKLGKDITISSPECYEFGKTASFTIREGDLCLIGKIKHTPTSLEAERPKFSDKYKYKIRFDANLDYYFGGTGNVGDPVLTTTTQPLTYSLIGSEDKCIIKCGNYYAFMSGERLSLTSLSSSATYFILHELEPNKFELLNYNSQSLGLNAHQGLYPWGTGGDYSDEIHWYNTGSPGNIVLFLPQESELIIRKIISTQEATTSYSGLMSKEDKAKLNSIASNANNYSLPAASSSTRGGIKIGYASSANNRAVQLSSEKAYVYIPNATTVQSGLMSLTDKEKLDGIANTYKPKQTAVTSPTTSGSAIDFIDSISLNVNGVVTATKKSVRNATISQSGLMSSSDKEKLDGVNTYKHYYTALSSMDFNLEAWFSVANIQDTESSIIQISTNGHTDVQFAVTTGWESPDDILKQGGSLTILNSFMGGANEYFAYVKGVRLRKENNYAKIEVLVNKPNSNDANKVSIVVSILTNAGHNPLVINNTQTTALQYVGTVNENTIVQRFNLEDKAIISKNLVVDNIKLKGYSLEDVSRQMHCLQSDPNLDFDASGNDGNCYGYVGTLQNMNISEKSVIIDSISAYVREGVASPNLGTSVWCRLLRYTNNAWEIVYQSTKSKTIKGVLPETLFTFHMEKVSNDYIINNTDRIAVTYVDSETADVLSGVLLGFKTVDKQGGLLNILADTSAGMNWSPALVFNYLPLSKAAISGDYNDLKNKPTLEGSSFKWSDLKYEPVDLGLPSGIRWASFNMGALSQEELGQVYAWGDSRIGQDSYVWGLTLNKFSKYCTKSVYGTVDNKTILDLTDDTARVKWGGKWRMPTKLNFEELLSECVLESSSFNGLDGYKFTGPNNNSIFFPTGQYFSNQLNADENIFAYVLGVDSAGLCGVGVNDRNLKLYIRPVLD